MEKKEKTIVMMIDLDGFHTNIDDETAELLVNQMDFIRKKFKANVANICLTTKKQNPHCLDNTLVILSKYLKNKVKFGLHFYQSGIYDYNTQQVEMIKRIPCFNYYTLQNFLDYNVDNPNIENKWFTYVCKGYCSFYEPYQEKEHPMIEILHSTEKKDAYSNLMFYQTKTKDFLAIVEGLSSYISTIKNLTVEEILEVQKNMVEHLNDFDINCNVRNNRFSFLEWYFKEGYLDGEGYVAFLNYAFYYRFNRHEITQEELVHFYNILNLLQNKFTLEKNDVGLERIRKIKKAWEEP